MTKKKKEELILLSGLAHAKHVIDKTKDEEAPMEEKYVMRCYDKFDGYWFDVKDDLTFDEAFKVWMKETKKGTFYTEIDHGTYYHIFPKETKMAFS